MIISRTGVNIIGFFVFWVASIFLAGKIAVISGIDRKTTEYLGIWGLLLLFIPLIMSFKFKLFKKVLAANVFMVLIYWLVEIF